MAWLKAAMGDGYMGIGRSSFMVSGTPANCMVIIVLMMSSHRAICEEQWAKNKD